MNQVTFKFQVGDLVRTANGKRGVVLSCTAELEHLWYQVETDRGRTGYHEKLLGYDHGPEECEHRWVERDEPKETAPPNIVNVKPGVRTANILGVDLPVIADLGDGWFLVAHPNAVAIATKHSMSALSMPSAETHAPHMLGGGSDIPETVRMAAVDAFEKLAWPLVRDQFYGPPATIITPDEEEQVVADTELTEEHKRLLANLETELSSVNSIERCSAIGGRYAAFGLHRDVVSQAIHSRISEMTQPKCKENGH